MKSKSENIEKPSPYTSNLHKQILEIKKKIQLSEGQRKAVFEECENEHKSNAERIQQLKIEIEKLITDLNTAKSPDYGGRRLEQLMGVTEKKTFDEIQEFVQLQIIDKEKQLNLLRFHIKFNQNFLRRLSEEYQRLLSGKIVQHVPFKSKIFDLQNNIHSIEIQLREANHIHVRYSDIRKNLMDDSAKFESNIEKIMREINTQLAQINDLVKVVEEAAILRTHVRSKLLEEERKALSTANARNNQTVEGQRLLNSGRQQLEMLEKVMFQGQKTTMKPEDANEDIVDDNLNEDEEIPESSSPSENEIFDIFEQLKQATGSTTTEEILERFINQRDTKKRLIQMRMKAEINKRTLEQHAEKLTGILEQYRYSGNKEKDVQALEMEKIQKKIAEEEDRKAKMILKNQQHHAAVEKVVLGIKDLHFCINPLQTDVDQMTPLQMIRSIYDSLSCALSKIDLKEFDEKGEREIIDEKALPPPYNTLIRKTPLPQQNSSPIPPPPVGSEEEEDVPSRVYLKRQAQLVVDAKLRRKKH